MQRYVLQTTIPQLTNVFGLPPTSMQSLKPNFNTAPGHIMPIIKLQENAFNVESAVWDPKRSTITIDEVLKKPNASLIENPCIVPVSGFYIWKQTVKDALPFYVRIHSQPILGIAAFVSQQEDFRTHFTVLTKDANVLVQPIEPMMPAILEEKQYQAWLSGSAQEIIQRRFPHNLMIPDMTVFRVPDLVNDLANNGPELLQPIPKVRDED